MRFSQSHTTINKHRIVCIAWALSNLHASGLGQLVGVTFNKRIKNKLFIQVTIFIMIGCFLGGCFDVRSCGYRFRRRIIDDNRRGSFNATNFNTNRLDFPRAQLINQLHYTRIKILFNPINYKSIRRKQNQSSIHGLRLQRS